MGTGYMSKDDTETIVVFGNDGIDPVTGAAWTLKIVRLDNGQYWNGSAWQAGVTTVNMTEADSVNLPGQYKYNFTPVGGGYICAVLAETTEESIAQKRWYGTLTVGYGFTDDIQIVRKFLANKAVAGSGAYTIYEDDGTTPFATGTISPTTRTPD